MCIFTFLCAAVNWKKKSQCIFSSLWNDYGVLLCLFALLYRLQLFGGNLKSKWIERENILHGIFSYERGRNVFIGYLRAAIELRWWCLVLVTFFNANKQMRYSHHFGTMNCIQIFQLSVPLIQIFSLMFSFLLRSSFRKAFSGQHVSVFMLCNSPVRRPLTMKFAMYHPSLGR